MSQLNLFVFFVFGICCSNFMFITGEKSLVPIKYQNFTNVIETFLTKYNGDNCSNALRKISQELMTNGNHNFLDSWKLTTTLELYSLNMYNLVEDDLRCKWICPDSTKKYYVNRYCIYEIYNDSLADGFVFALCVPPSCDETHVQILGDLARGQIAKGTKSQDRVKIQCSRRNEWEVTDTWTLTFVALSTYFLIFLAILASISYKIIKYYEHMGKVIAWKKWRKFLEIYSFQSNYKKLTASYPNTEINILHVMRVFGIVAMIFCHVHECTQAMAKNAQDFHYGKLFFWLCNNGNVIVGTFFVISGTLANYVTLCKFAKGDIPQIKGTEQLFATIKASFPEWSIMVANRYIRLIFLYFFWILMWTYAVPHITFFIPFVKFDALIQCPPRMLNHILMISNFDYRPYCMIWAWYLDADFQLYVFNRAVVWLFVHKPFWAFLTSLLLIISSCVTRIVLRSWYNLPPVMSYIMHFPQYDNNFHLNSFILYTKPYTWLSSYVVGMLIGYAAFHIRFKRSFNFNPIIQVFLWLCTIFFFLWSYFGIFWNANGAKSEIYDGFYIAFGPLLWSLACGWIILHSHVFSTSTFLQNFIKLKVFTFLSNLSLACCLVNFPVAYYLMSLYAYLFSDEPKFYFSTSLFFVFFVVVCISSYIVALFFYAIVEGPASNIRVILPKKYVKSGEKLN